MLLLNPSALRTPTAALVAAGILGIFAASLLVARLEVAANVERWRLLRPLPAPARARLAAVIPSFVSGMRVLRGSRPVTIAIAMSILAWMAEVSVYWMMGRAFGLELGLSEAVLVMIAANVIVSLPLTPWDIGPYEVAVTEALAIMGFGLSQAGAYAVGSHILLVIWDQHHRPGGDVDAPGEPARADPARCAERRRQRDRGQGDRGWGRTVRRARGRPARHR